MQIIWFQIEFPSKRSHLLSRVQLKHIYGVELARRKLWKGSRAAVWLFKLKIE